jgi:uncharacterized cupin superfamily protein
MRGGNRARDLKGMQQKGESFSDDGFVGPVPLFTHAQCALIMHHLRYGNASEPLAWEKGHAASDHFFFQLATRPALLAQLRLLLGSDILLWGVSLVTREPNQVHPWHTDIESSAPGGQFASVWIGIENTSRESALQLITGSHVIGKTIQQVAYEHGVRRGEATAATVLDWAREAVPSARFVQPAMNDGDALFFDGRLWHGSENMRAEGARTALLFQYVAAGNPVKMPDFGQLEWPFQFKRSRVPVLLVSGSDSTRTNYVVPSPVPRVTPLANQFRPLKLPIPEDRVRRWRPQHLFAGTTPNVLRMNAHVSVLSPGYSPHAPHAHSEEEILIVLDGEAELVIARSESGSDARYERLRAGSFVYYPAFQFHTIHNPTATPITYLMFKWTGLPWESEAPLKTTLNKTGRITRTTDVPFAAEVVLEGATHYLAKLHVHITELQPGAGYAHHADDHDVAIVVLSGMVETMGHRMEPHSVVYFPAHEMHDMKNPGPSLARYLVFEFDGSSAGEASASLPTVPRRLSLQGGRYRAYWGLRRRFAATPLWQVLRPIYRRLR